MGNIKGDERRNTRYLAIKPMIMYFHVIVQQPYFELWENTVLVVLSPFKIRVNLSNIILNNNFKNPLLNNLELCWDWATENG